MADIVWYIVFTDEDVGPHWIHRVLKKGFFHCYCFRKIGDYIYYANPTTSNIDSRIYEKVVIGDLISEIKKFPNSNILEFKYPFDINNKMFNIWNLAPTCVNIVKMFLGVSVRAQTPYQLYKQLLAKGAQTL